MMLRYLLYSCFFLCSMSMIVHAQPGSDEQLALHYFQNSEFEKAVEIYKQLYSRSRSDVHFRYLKDSYVQLGNYSEAEKLIKKHIKRSGANAAGYFVELGYIYQLGGSQKKADREYQEAIETVVKRGGHQVHAVARAFTDKQLYEYALSTYRRVEKIQPNQIYNYHIAGIYAQMGAMERMYEEYLELLNINKNYLQTVKNYLSQYVSDDPENERNEKLRELLLRRVQTTRNESFSNLLIWLFIQEKNFNNAFVQVRAIDKRNNGNQSKVYELAKVAYTNQAYDVALKCYNYIIEIGQRSPYYLDAKVESLYVLQQKVVSSVNYNDSDLVNLENKYQQVLDEFGKTRFTVLLMKDFGHLKGFYLHQAEKAVELLEEALDVTQANPRDLAMVKIELGDLFLLAGEVWEAILYYSQVEKQFKESPIGQEAKFRRARVSYYQADFAWAQAQLDVLKASTSKLIANDAMKLSLLISDNTALDTTETAMRSYAHADLLAYQNKDTEALTSLDSLIEAFPGHELIDESLYKKAQLRIKRKEYQKAAANLEAIVESYSFQILADDALYQLALLKEEVFQDQEGAKELYQKIILDHSDSIYVAEARKRFRLLRGDKIQGEESIGF